MDIFLPGRIGPFELKNRIAMAPMTRCRSGPEGVPTELNALYYAQRASAGLIVTEATQVSPQGVGYVDTPGIHNSSQAEGWKKVIKEVKRRGSRIFLQLFHCGRISHPDLQEGGALPVAPSEVRPAGELHTREGKKPYPTPRALATDEIPGVVEQFRSAAEYALEAGFDGVEIHSANGYLPAQFLEDKTNRRTDEYGGSVENRCRFTLEVTEAAAGVLGAERVGVHISPGNPFNDMGDSDPEGLYTHLARELGKMGLAYLSVSEIDLSTGEYSGEPNAVTRKIRDIFDGPYMTNGGYDHEKAEKVLEGGRADLVSFGRLYIANPDLPERFRTGAELNEPDPSTFYGRAEEGYTDYPFMEQKKQKASGEK